MKTKKPLDEEPQTKKITEKTLNRFNEELDTVSKQGGPKSFISIKSKVSRVS
jgi:hypothetical protein